MALNGLLDIEVSVTDPQVMYDFWLRHGLVATADGVLGTVDRPVQMKVKEGTHRHLSSMHLSCESEKDISDIAQRLEASSIAHQLSGTTLRCTDPVFGHSVVIDVGSPHALTPSQAKAFNRPGQQTRSNMRAEAVRTTTPQPPRRVGHVVLGTPRMAEAVEFYVNILGYRISDQMLKGVATFMRVESDHHNLMIQPGPTSYLNHYALEVDDIDEVGLSGRAVLEDENTSSVVGVGRHNLGANVFWYLRDPAGNMFEFFSDMDQIVDEDDWQKNHCKLDWEGADGPAGFSVWGPKNPPTEFFSPPDIADIAAAREALGLK